MVEFYRPRIFRFALASLRDRDAAETIAQDCFMKAHRAYPTFRGESSVQTWLIGIALTLIRDKVRNRRFQFWRRAGQSRPATEDLILANLPAEERTPEQQATL